MSGTSVRDAGKALGAKAQRLPLAGLVFAVLGAVAFSGKAIVIKLSYRYGVDAMTLIMLRMLFALPVKFKSWTFLGIMLVFVQ